MCTITNIAGGVPGVEVRNMTGGAVTGCLHDYQLTPDDLKTLSGASVFIVNGGGSDGAVRGAAISGKERGNHRA